MRSSCNGVRTAVARRCEARPRDRRIRATRNRDRRSLARFRNRRARPRRARIEQTPRARGDAGQGYSRRTAQRRGISRCRSLRSGAAASVRDQCPRGGRAARLAAARGTVFVTVSTDYVFDGKTGEPYAESDAPDPLSAYGVELAGGRTSRRGAGGRAFVVRTCGLYGAARRRRAALPLSSGPPAGLAGRPGPGRGRRLRFADLRQRSRRRAPRAGRDGAPTDSITRRVREPVSWFDFASRGARPGRGRGRRSSRSPPASGRPRAIRPRFSALDNAKLRGLGIVHAARGAPAWLTYLGALADIGVR